MEISPVELRKVIETDDDFGHELRAGHVIQKHPVYQSLHGGTYMDLVSQKPRQFDYRCWLTIGGKRLVLAVECKNLSQASPLVICGVPRRKEESFHHLILSRFGGFQRHSTYVDGYSSITQQANGKDSLYHQNTFVGKSVLRVQSTKKPMAKVPDADIYDKWSQALASGHDLARKACDYASKLTELQCISAVLPIVVVPDGVLWKAEYGAEGSLLSDPSQAAVCEFYVGREVEVGGKKGTPFFHVFAFSHIHFFTLTGFDSFLSEMANDLDSWNQIFTDKAVEI